MPVENFTNRFLHLTDLAYRELVNNHAEPLPTEPEALLGSLHYTVRHSDACRCQTSSDQNFDDDQDFDD